MMKLKDLDIGEKFKFNKEIWTKGKVVGKVRHELAVDNVDIYLCTSSESRRRPFNGLTVVEPMQRRINE